MKYERGRATPPDMNKRQDDEFGFGPNLFGLTPPCPSVVMLPLSIYATITANKSPPIVFVGCVDVG
jgi:hypothetical protein